MRMLATAVFCVLTSLAAANHHEKIYKGHGVYEKDGVEQGYEIMVHKKHLGEGKGIMTTTITREGQAPESWSMYVKHGEGRHVTFHNHAMEQIGSGYCFGTHDGTGKVCHMDVEPAPGVHLEKTVHVTMDRAHSIGSMTDADGSKIIWNDHMKRIFPFAEEK